MTPLPPDNHRSTTLPLTDAQLAAIDKLEQLAAAHLAKLLTSEAYTGSFHDPNVQLLANVPIWARHVREAHANVYAQHTVESLLYNLRRVARTFKFEL